MDRYLSELKSRNLLIAREKAENVTALAKAQTNGENVTFVAADGCEVTITPAGHVFHNAADWW